MTEGAREAEVVSHCRDFRKSAKSRSNRLVFPKTGLGRDQARFERTWRPKGVSRTTRRENLHSKGSEGQPVIRSSIILVGATDCITVRRKYHSCSLWNISHLHLTDRLRETFLDAQSRAAKRFNLLTTLRARTVKRSLFIGQLMSNQRMDKVDPIVITNYTKTIE